MARAEAGVPPRGAEAGAGPGRARREAARHETALRAPSGRYDPGPAPRRRPRPAKSRLRPRPAHTRGRLTNAAALSGRGVRGPNGAGRPSASRGSGVVGGRRGAGSGGGPRDLGAAAGMGAEGRVRGRRDGLRGQGPGPGAGPERARRAPCRAHLRRPGLFPEPVPGAAFSERPQMWAAKRRSHLSVPCGGFAAPVTPESALWRLLRSGGKGLRRTADRRRLFLHP